MADRGSFRGRGDRGDRGDRGGRGGRGGRGDRGSRGSGYSYGGDRGGGYQGGAQQSGRPPGGGYNRPSAQVFNPSGTIPRPDETITAAENSGGKTIIELDLSKLSMSEQDENSFPRRAGFGTQGTPVVLWANHFQITTNPQTRLFRYRIVFEDDKVKAKRKIARIIELLLQDEKLSRCRNNIATDFRQHLISSQKLEPNEMIFDVKYTVEGDNSTGDRPPPVYKITLELNGEFTMARMIDYLTSSNVSAAIQEKADIIQMLNIIFGHGPKSDNAVMSVGANKHFGYPGRPQPNSQLGNGLLAWRGFFISVRSATARLLLNVQVKNVAVYEHGPLVKVVDSFWVGATNNNRRLEAFLKGLRVQTNHLRTSNGKVIKKTKTIFGLARMTHQRDRSVLRIDEDYAGANKVSFFLDASSRAGIPATSIRKGFVSVAEFFQRKHGVATDTRYPVVNVGDASKPSYLPLEVCLVLQGQPARTKLSSRQTQNMISFAVRRPWENATSISTEGISTLSLTRANPTLANFGLGVDGQLITVAARLLSSPEVAYAGKSAAPFNAKWNMNGIRFTTAKTVPSWVVLRVTSRDRQQGQDPFDSLVQEFTRNLNTCGMTATSPGHWFYCTPHPMDIAAKMKEISEKKDGGKRIDLVLVILQDDGSGPYSAVKIAGDVTYGLHTICVTEKTLGKANVQLYANLALKFNLKLGGTNQSLKPGKLHVIELGRTMVVGIDVTHPSPGSSEGAPSVAGMVASVDKHLGQWPAAFRRQESRKEMVHELGDMLKTRLRLWREKNGELPGNILVYRDGVSEGQYRLVLEQELTAMKQACTEIYPATDTANKVPRVSVIVVGKRHHTRFYPTTTNEGQMDTRSHNTRHGTVVDRGVTEQVNWDFFLQAHTALQGTARPAHYYVLHDEIFCAYFRYMTGSSVAPAHRPLANILRGMKCPADMVEDLTHNLSYLFGRATMAVSICPAAYYADLLCERARVYFKDEFDPSDDASNTTGTSGSVQGRDRTIHPRLQNSMYYI